MAIPTTTIGAYPKPDYLPITDWFAADGGLADGGGEVTRAQTRALARADKKTEALFVRATHEAVRTQRDCGIDIPTDGEQRRENYIHYHCRNLTGFDFDNLTHRVLREGAYKTDLPTIRGAVTSKPGHFLDRDFAIAQAVTRKPVKITVPGPMTIMDTTVNDHYSEPADLARDLADALNVEIRALADAGCRHIQVDEPVFARNVDQALAFGVECVERCFHKVPPEVTRVMHICCGYPQQLDDEDYHKADREAYFELAEIIDYAAIDQISLEDAHRHNDLALLERFARSSIILGVVSIASSRLESIDEIRERLVHALDHIDANRLVAAPDCGLGLLGPILAREKLAILSQAARSI
jgi:5-methyltetrahydropteroyltriglutamate--homocysteine methyltransferase